MFDTRVYTFDTLQLGDQLGAFVEEEVVETNIARGWKERARVSINFCKRLKLTPVHHFWTLRRDTIVTSRKQSSPLRPRVAHLLCNAS